MSDLSVRSKLQLLRDADPRNTAKGDTLVDYRSLAEWKGQEQEPSHVSQREIPGQGQSQSTHQHLADVAGRASASFQHILFKERDCWGKRGSVWKRMVRVSSSTARSLTCRHLQWDLIVGLIMFQYLFESLGWHHQVCRSSKTEWELTICWGSVWQGTQLQQSKGRVLLLGWNNLCNTPCCELHG